MNDDKDYFVLMSSKPRLLDVVVFYYLVFPSRVDDKTEWIFLYMEFRNPDFDKL